MPIKLSPLRSIARPFVAALAVGQLWALGGGTLASANGAKQQTHAESKQPAARSQPKPAMTQPPNQPQNASKQKPQMTMDQFLNHLMIAESNGNDQARNRLSTATGSFQFIEATFIYVMRQHFPKRIENLNTAQILALRTDRTVARDAARAYTKDNAGHLAAAGHKPTFPRLRLAYLLGPGGAVRILDAKPSTPLRNLLGPSVIRANPWMIRHTASSLVARSARDVSLAPTTTAGIEPRRDPVTGKLVLAKRPKRPRIRVRCNLSRPSCRRWLALERRKLARRKSSKRRVARSKR